MRLIAVILSATLVAALALSCYEDATRDNVYDQKNWSIVYPDDNFNGENLLSVPDGTLALNYDYSLRVKIEGYHKIMVEVFYPEGLALSGNPLKRHSRSMKYTDWTEYQDWETLENNEDEYSEMTDNTDTGIDSDALPGDATSGSSLEPDGPIIKLPLEAKGPGNFSREVTFSGADATGSIEIKIYEDDMLNPKRIKYFNISQ